MIKQNRLDSYKLLNVKENDFNSLFFFFFLLHGEGEAPKG